VPERLPLSLGEVFYLSPVILFCAFMHGGCAAPVRPAGSPSHDNDTLTTDEALLEGETGVLEGPPPPARAESPRVSPARAFTIAAGLQACTTERPDLSASLWSIDLRSSLPPEDLLLLQNWARASVSRELRKVQVHWSPQVCETSFLCFSASPQDGPAIGAALGKVLPSLPIDLFYPSRSAVTKIAEEWDRSSADWKLHAAARALTRSSPSRAQLHAATPASNQSLVTVVKRESGAARISKLDPPALHDAWMTALSRARIVHSSPSHVDSSFETFQAVFSPKKPVTIGAPKVLAPPPVPTILEDHAGDWTQAALVWELSNPIDREPVDAALVVALSRFRSQTDTGVRARLEAPHAFFSMPALRLEGPHEDVLSAISELSTELDRLVSAYGAPSREERTRALRFKPHIQHFEERCISGGQDEAGQIESGRNILRQVGGPVVIVWGRASSPPPSE
jgi:hypothetical protein